MKNLTLLPFIGSGGPRGGDEFDDGTDPGDPLDGAGDNADPFDGSAADPVAAGKPPVEPAAGKPPVEPSAGKAPAEPGGKAPAEDPRLAEFSSDWSEEDRAAAVANLDTYKNYTPEQQAEILSGYANSTTTVTDLQNKITALQEAAAGGEKAPPADPKKAPPADKDKAPIDLASAMEQISALKGRLDRRDDLETRQTAALTFEREVARAVQADPELADSPQALQVVKLLSDSELLRTGAQKLPGNVRRHLEPHIASAKEIISSCNGEFVKKRAGVLEATLGETGTPGAPEPDDNFKGRADDMDSREFEEGLESDAATGLVVG